MKRRHRSDAERRRPQIYAEDGCLPQGLTKSASEALGSLLQLALQNVNLLRNVLKLFLGNTTSLGNLMSLAIRSADRGTDSYRYSR